MKSYLLFCLVFITTIACGQKDNKTVLFVCEHGTAKSVVAAEYFRKMAAKEGLEIRTVSRGTHPDEAVPEKINQILVGDGFEKHTTKPVKLSQKDLKEANYVIVFSALPAEFSKPGQLETWNIPSFEAGYPIARDSIINNIERLLVRIKSDHEKK